uniref:Uncharacterized protein n=1 Tax=Anopheles dirus TaxID=7168 RepID=A0A182NU31_9DIPT
RSGEESRSSEQKEKGKILFFLVFPTTSSPFAWTFAKKSVSPLAWCVRVLFGLGSAKSSAVLNKRNRQNRLGSSPTPAYFEPRATVKKVSYERHLDGVGARPSFIIFAAPESLTSGGKCPSSSRQCYRSV